VKQRGAGLTPRQCSQQPGVNRQQQQRNHQERLQCPEQRSCPARTLFAPLDLLLARLSAGRSARNRGSRLERLPRDHQCGSAAGVVAVMEGTHIGQLQSSHRLGATTLETKGQHLLVEENAQDE
jgi:hypothetical protein